MYHIIYLTTNLVNSKIYVGVHSTYNLEDGYLGSGKTLLKAVSKYGESQFNRQILYICNERSHANDLESLIVDEWFISRKDTYNIKCGGLNGMHSIETKQKISEIQKGIPKSEEFKLKVSNTLTGYKRPPRSKTHCINLGNAVSKTSKGKPKSKEHSEKVRQSNIGRTSTDIHKEHMSEARNKAYNMQLLWLSYFTSLKYSQAQIEYALEILNKPRNGFSGKNMSYIWNILFTH